MAGRAFIVLLSIGLIGLAVPAASYAHGGHTDANGCHKTARQESAIVTGLRSPRPQHRERQAAMSNMRIAKQPGQLVRRLSDAVSLDMVGILIGMVMGWLVSDFCKKKMVRLE